MLPFLFEVWPVGIGNGESLKNVVEEKGEALCSCSHLSMATLLEKSVGN